MPYSPSSWLPESSSPGLSSMSACMHPSIRASHNCCGHNRWVGLVFSPASCNHLLCLLWAHWAWFFPMLLRGQAAAAVVSLMGGTHIQASCLLSASVTVAGALNGSVSCLCSQQISLAAETVSVLVCEVTYRAGVTLEWYQSWPGYLSDVMGQELLERDSC